MHNLNRTGKNITLSGSIGKLNPNYYFLLACSLLFYGQNNIVDLISILLISILFLINIKRDNFILSYFALIFFEPILTLPFGGGSFFRIYQLMFLLRISIDVLNYKKYKLNFRVNIIAAILFLLLSLLYTESIEGIVSSLINILILIYITIYKGETEKEETYSKILSVIGIFAALSGIYGMLYGSGINYGYTMRTGATIGDPNYSSLFYTLGLFSLVGTHSISKALKIVLTVILCVSLMLTVSISGIIGTILLFVLFAGVSKISKGILIGATALLTIVIFIQNSFTSGTAFYGLQYRILSILRSNDLGIITSNRSDIATYYIRQFQNLPVIKQIFGGSNTISGEIRDMMVDSVGAVSHNSYIDMLYLIGIVGTTIIIFLFIVMICKLIKKYKQTNNIVFLSVAFLKITILYYSLSISIFPFRYFYTLFIL